MRKYLVLTNFYREKNTGSGMLLNQAVFWPIKGKNIVLHFFSIYELMMFFTIKICRVLISY